jgi:hypothetical protein
VHLRRALLLFAIVLGLAAVAASVSRTDRTRPSPPPPPSDTTADTAQPGTATTAGPDPGSTVITFEQGGRRELRKLPVDSAATVLVRVVHPGEAELPGLASVRAAEPATPASFDVFGDRPGSFPVLFHPAAGGSTERIGTLRLLAR